MAAPVLADYQYMYKDTGILLNNDYVPGSAVWDVTSVTGLDMPPIQVTINDADGIHGSYVNAKYFTGRTIVIDGTLYINTNLEASLDALNTNFAPDDTNYPFYFKAPGTTQRFVYAKSLGVKCPTDTLRRIGNAPFQVQLFAERPVKIANKVDRALTNNTSVLVPNVGNSACYPIFTIVGAYTSITLNNQLAGKLVTITYTCIAGDITIVDFANRTVTINGINRSGAATVRNWWTIGVGSQNIKYTFTGAAPTSVTLTTYDGWI